MVTKLAAAAAATPGAVLSGLLGSVNGEVTLALNVAGVLVPLVKGAISEIRQIATSSGSVAYSVLLQTDGEELNAIDALSVADLTAINAELTRVGATPLPVPAPAAAPAAVLAPKA